MITFSVLWIWSLLQMIKNANRSKISVVVFNRIVHSLITANNKNSRLRFYLDWIYKCKFAKLFRGIKKSEFIIGKTGTRIKYIFYLLKWLFLIVLTFFKVLIGYYSVIMYCPFSSVHLKCAIIGIGSTIEYFLVLWILG